MYMYMYDVLKIRAMWLAEISRDGNPRLQKKKSLPGGAALTAMLWAGGTHFIKQLFNFNTSKWLPAKDIHLVPSCIRPLFVRLFQRDISRLHHTISSSFPELFNLDVLFQHVSPLEDLPTRPFSPSCVFVDKDTEVSSLSSKSFYLLFNQNINDNSSPTLTPWHDRVRLLFVFSLHPLESNLPAANIKERRGRSI